ncbi:AsmA family protein [Spongiivirga citrea]|uniref:AsmA family protein n=1 Tax=Spongiivirga citrea TaxID=1481457 RepID=A0A6M0CMU7_9FLAO|nr:AsmA family protein [Spongiivirga citrea]NER18263.1 AsmA family protein [Spongiivirga citrea]
MKKVLKILGILLVIVLAALIIIPIAFEDKILNAVKDNINKNLNAELSFVDVDLSLLSSFPNASLSLEDVALTNFEPFKGDTLIAAKEISIDMGLMQLFKDASSQIKVNTLHIDEAFVNVKVDSLGNANYDIAKKTSASDIEQETESTSSEAFVFDIENYEIKNSRIHYYDKVSHISLDLVDFNHSGQGSFSENESKLDTKTTAIASFGLDETQYLNNNQIDLDAVIGLDLKNSKYSFLENQMMINQLPLKFDGFVDVNDDNQEIDITFSTPKSEFRNFFALIPKEYAKNIEGISTRGDFKLEGSIKGVSDDKTIPKMDISMKSSNASFKYPDLPKTVKDINIDAAVKNETGKLADTYVRIGALDFSIDADRFTSKGTIKQLLSNPLIIASLKGKIDLDKIAQAYPMPENNELKGSIRADLSTSFDMNAIEKGQYERIKSQGTAEVSDFLYASDDVVNPITIKDATINFKNADYELASFNATSGSSDISAKGSIDNLYGYLFSDKKLKGNFTINSNKFVVSDFMVADEEATTSENSGSDSEKEESLDHLKIPAFLDVELQANANSVVYDNLNLKNVSGTVQLKDEKAILKEVKSKLFDGSIVLRGDVATGEKIPVYNMQLGIEDFDIAKSFAGMEMLEKLAPIAKVITGKLNTTLNINGELNNDFSPKLESVSGTALAKLFTEQVNTENSPLLSALTSNLSFLEKEKINLKDISTKLAFDKGKVAVSPFNLKYKDIDIQVAGSHGFDRTMDYKATLNVPAKYLGSEVNKLLNQLNDPETNELTVPVVASLTGSFTIPKVNTDLKNAVENLTNQLVQIQKEKLKNKGKNLLHDLVLGNNKKTDSTKTANDATDVLQNVVGGILGGTKKKTDSTKTKSDSIAKKDPVKDAATNILGGLFKKKKKKKDTVN